MKDSSLWASLPSLLRSLGVKDDPQRVLIVEDEPTIRDGLSRALSALGHLVEAREGVERHELPLRGYGVAILDNYFLSGSLTGVSLTPELRRSCPQILVLAISSDAGKNEEMIRRGANLSILKPALRRLL